RRRHTRSKRDWSSDVCSSDLLFELTKPGVLENVIIKTQHNCMSDQRVYSGRFIPIVHEYVLLVRKDAPLAVSLMMTYRVQSDIQIGRASCRERVWVDEVVSE